MKDNKKKSKSLEKDSRVRRQPSVINQQDQPSAHAERQKRIIESKPIGIKSVLIRMLAVSLGIFFVGFCLTWLYVEMLDYQKLPSKGNTIMYGNRNYWIESYPSLRSYAKTGSNIRRGTESSRFEDIGSIGTGLFFFSLINSMHWIVEMSIHALGNIVFIPPVLIILGSIIFFFNMLPPPMQTRTTGLYCSYGIGLLYSILFLIVWYSLILYWDTFSHMFGRPYMFSGDQMIIKFAAFPIILMTGIFYGAIAGGILYFVAAFREVWSQSEYEHAP
jgi:hypothetical protein